MPLYRQSEIYARDGVKRSTLADWVGASTQLLIPRVKALKDYGLSADKLHADDTPVPVLQPGRGKTKTGRLWAYVRDDRPCGSTDPPAVWFQYSPDRKGEHPLKHWQRFSGVLQADAYAGFVNLDWSQLKLDIEFDVVEKKARHFFRELVIDEESDEIAARGLGVVSLVSDRVEFVEEVLPVKVWPPLCVTFISFQLRLAVG